MGKDMYDEIISRTKGVETNTFSIAAGLHQGLFWADFFFRFSYRLYYYDEVIDYSLYSRWGSVVSVICVRHYFNDETKTGIIYMLDMWRKR